MAATVVVCVRHEPPIAEGRFPFGIDGPLSEAVLKIIGEDGRKRGVLHCVSIPEARPVQIGAVGGDVGDREVRGSWTSLHSGEELFCAPITHGIAAVGTHLHGVAHIGRKSGERVGVLGDINGASLIAVHADLPFGGGAVLGPAQLRAVLSDVGNREVRGSRTGRCGIADHEHADESAATAYMTEEIGLRRFRIYQIEGFVRTLLRPEQLASLHVKGHILIGKTFMSCGTDNGGGGIGQIHMAEFASVVFHTVCLSCTVDSKNFKLVACRSDFYGHVWLCGIETFQHGGVIDIVYVAVNRIVGHGFGKVRLEVGNYRFEIRDGMGFVVHSSSS